MRMRLAAVVAAVALLAGCSGPSDGAESPQPVATTQEPSPTPSEDPTTVEPVDQVEVPDVVGMDGLAAQREIEGAGLALDGSAEGEPTDVASQDPEAGTMVDDGSEVSLELVPPAVIDHEIEIEDENIYVWVESTMSSRDAWLITRDLAMNEDLDEGGYFVQFNCTEGGTAGAWNRQANGKIAIGNRGAALTGLNDGAFQSELLDGATCP
ncbi:PASTA domain-containing protein [Ruania suaedae]|uniref:PASTA domain-containing protein n=1 Tax=Ruania suaedae TaxID=2897774 RepID=UPI001E59E9EB|nr:PASTA domain-containing protein [Ruania suaedae]UFU03439.1 PASTA domain-containing protein [Ruania suaedae]